MVNANVTICFGMMARIRLAKHASLPVWPALISPTAHPVILLVTDCSTLPLISLMSRVLSVSACIAITHPHSIKTAFPVIILARYVLQEPEMTVYCVRLRQNDFWIHQLRPVCVWMDIMITIPPKSANFAISPALHAPLVYPTPALPVHLSTTILLTRLHAILLVLSSTTTIRLIGHANLVHRTASLASMELIAQYAPMDTCSINKSAFLPVLVVLMLIMCLECAWIVPRDALTVLATHNVLPALRDSILTVL